MIFLSTLTFEGTEILHLEQHLNDFIIVHNDIACHVNLTISLLPMPCCLNCLP